MLYTKRAVGSMRSFDSIMRWKSDSGEFNPLSAGNEDKVVYKKG